MCSWRSVIAALAIAGAPTWSCAQNTSYVGIGRAATPAELAAWDTDVRPDFKGLPKGSGTVAQGQQIWKKDQAGNVIETDFDTSGRETARKVTTLISGFDGAVKRIATTYDSLGRRSLSTARSSLRASAYTARIRAAGGADPGSGFRRTAPSSSSSAIGITPLGSSASRSSLKPIGPCACSAAPDGRASIRSRSCPPSPRSSS